MSLGSVLVIDDSRAVQVVVSNYLELAGVADILTAKSVEEASATILQMKTCCWPP